LTRSHFARVASVSRVIIPIVSSYSIYPSYPIPCATPCGGCLGKRNDVRAIKSECVGDHVHQTPERKHHYKPDNSPEDKIVALADTVWITTRKYIPGSDSVEKYDKRNGEEERYEHVVDDLNYGGGDRTNVFTLCKH
jgi:hypothetical protein